MAEPYTYTNSNYKGYNFRKTSQYGSVSCLRSAHVPILSAISEKLVSMAVSSTISSAYSETTEFQKNQLVWQSFNHSYFLPSFFHLFQKNQLVWQRIYRITFHFQFLHFRKTSQYGRTQSLGFQKGLFPLFQKNQLVWQQFSLVPCLSPT